ncbi:MAG TPA: tryptophan synthase subunit alpha [Polyangiaceae bacterium]|nr:tryptophan synthase subunit alpha [Polyangiaceae bacterium]
MTVERIDRTFSRTAEEKRPALVAYLCVGDPSVADSKACALACVEAGADILEIGVPFSDPTADGPVIAAAAYRAIHHGGSLRSALDVVGAVRERSEAPVVLFTYYNPIVAFGESALPKAAREAGVDALLVVDLPPEEGEELRAAAKTEQLAVIPLLAPTSDTERERSAFSRASGFVYYVSVTGVTGTASISMEEASGRANELRARAKLPVVVGFGIDSGEKAKVAKQHGVSGIVVGTAIVKAIAAGADTAARVSAVKKLVGELRAGLT